LTEVKKNPKLITLSHNDFNIIIKVYSKDYKFFTHPLSPQVGENNLQTPTVISSKDSIVTIIMCLLAGQQRNHGSILSSNMIFFSFQYLETKYGAHKTTIHWRLRYLTLEVKQSGHEANHSHHSSDEIYEVMDHFHIHIHGIMLN